MRTTALLVAVAVVMLMGCASGGGPYVGYGTKRGLIYGAEAGGGLGVAQVAIGMQNKDLFRYFRIDLTGNVAGWKRQGEFGGGGRFGIGYGGGNTHGGGGVFAMGGNLGYNFEKFSCGYDDEGTVGLLGAELRYAGGEWQFIATSRVELVQDLCLH